MKSLAELQAIRQKTLERINLRREDASENVRVVIGMATCGIAAGARHKRRAAIARVFKHAEHLRQKTVRPLHSRAGIQDQNKFFIHLEHFGLVPPCAFSQLPFKQSYNKSVRPLQEPVRDLYTAFIPRFLLL